MDPTTTPHLSLARLVRPLSPEAFMESHWLQRAHHCEATDDAPARVLLDIDALADVQRLARIYGEPIPVWTPPRLATRAERGYGRYLSPLVALELYHLGSTLFFEHVDRYEPRLRPLLRSLERELGLPEGSGYCSVFASRAGAGSRAHFDPEFNFCIQLRGTKRWRIHENDGVVLPPVGVGVLDADLPESLARCGDPERMAWAPERARAIELRPGDVLFFPPGCWHETEAKDDCLSAVLSFEPPSTLDHVLTRLRGLARDLGAPEPGRASMRAWLDTLATMLEGPAPAPEVRP